MSSYSSAGDCSWQTDVQVVIPAVQYILKKAVNPIWMSFMLIASLLAQSLF